MSTLASWASEASVHAQSVDLLAFCLMVLVVLLSAPVFILITIFAIKYRRGRPANRKHPVDRNVLLEVSWAIIPFMLLLVFYVWSTRLFIDLGEPPANALQIDVTGKQWMWKFEHPGGQREIDDLHVPVGEPVKLVMASEDVIHSLYIPALRIKQDVVPGRYTTTWFKADTTGIFHLTCTQFCGTDHSVMGGRFIVMSETDYANWLQSAGTDGSLVAEGADLFRSLGCSGCHSPQATVRAPPLGGLFGKPVSLSNGQTVVADDQYLRDSILLPHSQVVAGYPDTMPTFQNVIGEGDVLKLVAYLKSLTPQPGEGRS